MNKETFKVAGLSSVAGMMLVGVASVAADTNSAPVVSEQVASNEAESFACGDVLAQGDGAVLAMANADASADCMFVGCGGVF